MISLSYRFDGQLTVNPADGGIASELALSEAKGILLGEPVIVGPGKPSPFLLYYEPLRLHRRPTGRVPPKAGVTARLSRLEWDPAQEASKQRARAKSMGLFVC